MLSAYMPAELVAHVTGHELGTSALWEYLDCTRALCIPGATVLAGWPAFPWGNHGMGPSPPSLDAIISPLLDMEKLEGIVDEVFRLDGATNPVLWKGGDLRPLLHAAFASGVMYFEERTKAGEMPRVQVIPLPVTLKSMYGYSAGLGCLGLPWAIHGLYMGYPQVFLRLSSTCPWAILRLYMGYPKVILGLPLGYPWASIGLPWAALGCLGLS